jgi:hypothetical protein
MMMIPVCYSTCTQAQAAWSSKEQCSTADKRHNQLYTPETTWRLKGCNSRQKRKVQTGSFPLNVLALPLKAMALLAAPLALPQALNSSKCAK